MDDMIQMLEKIKRPEYRELVRKQIEMLAEIGELTKECAMYIVSGELHSLYSYFSKRLKDYLPQAVFHKIWEDTILGLGDYIELGETTKALVTHDMYEIYYQILAFEKNENTAKVCL